MQARRDADGLLQGHATPADRAATGIATFNVQPGAGRRLFRQDPVLLLHRADAAAGRDAGRRRSCSTSIPRIADEPRPQGPQLDHPVLHLLPLQERPAGCGSERRRGHAETVTPGKSNLYKLRQLSSAARQRRTTETDTMAEAHAKQPRLPPRRSEPVAAHRRDQRLRDGVRRCRDLDEGPDDRRPAARPLRLRRRHPRRALHHAEPGGRTSSARRATRATTPASCSCTTATA